MLLPPKTAHRILERLILARHDQGFDTKPLLDRLGATLSSRDAQQAMLESILAAPLRPDWPYDEPNDLQSILPRCDPDGPRRPLPLRPGLDPAEAVRCAFLARICGCMLGKPLEVNANLE